MYPLNGEEFEKIPKFYHCDVVSRFVSVTRMVHRNVVLNFQFLLLRLFFYFN